jgi:hypothetical protein
MGHHARSSWGSAYGVSTVRLTAMMPRQGTLWQRV